MSDFHKISAASAPSSLVSAVNVSASPTALVSGNTYLVTTSTIPITLNLPAPVANAWFIIKDVYGSASVNNITVHRSGSESIDGNFSDKVLKQDRGTWIIMSDGTNWWTLNQFKETSLQLAAGTVAAPPLTFGDIGTGIYRSGTDELSIANNGSQHFWFTATGRLGIGQPPSSLNNNEGIRVSRTTAGSGSTDAVDIIVTNQGTGACRHVASCEGSATETTSYLNAFGSGQAGNWWNSGAAQANSCSIQFQNGTGGNVFEIFGGSSAFDFLQDNATAQYNFRYNWPSGTNIFQIADTAVTSFKPFIVSDNKVQISTAKTPSSATDTGTTGQICWDSGFIYVCVATNTWKRVAIATW